MKADDGAAEETSGETAAEEQMDEMAPPEEQPAAEEEEEEAKPPSNRIVFTSERTGNRDIFVINADGRGLMNLTQNDARDEEPGISEDGKLVVYTSDRFGTRDVFMQNVETGEVKRLTDNYVDDFEPDISPDGRSVIFTRKLNIPSKTNRSVITFFHQLYMIDLESMEETLISPDGKQGRNARFVHGQDGAYLYELDGALWLGDFNMPEQVKRLTFRGSDKSSGTVLVNSAKLVYSSPNLKTRGDQEIYFSKADGSFEKRITRNTADDVEPSVSPDEKLVVWSSNRDGNWELYLLNWETNELKRLTSNDGSDREPDISG